MFALTAKISHESHLGILDGTLRPPGKGHDISPKDHDISPMMEFDFRKNSNDDQQI